MEGRILLVFLASVALTSAELLCIEADCKEPDLKHSDNIEESLSEPVNLNINKEDEDSNFAKFVENALMNMNTANRFDDAIDPNTNATEGPPQTLFIIRIRESIIVPNEDVVNNPFQPPFQIFEELNKMFEDIGILDLSGKYLTGDELASILSQRQVPVTSLVLSNARITDLTPDSFRPVQDSLQMLKMDNCTISLQALSQLNNLRFLNLSHNELATFEWFPQMSDSLEVLDLSHNHFKEVRPELSILTSLKELYLSHNWITSVTEKPLDMLSSLEVLTLSMNSIKNANLADLSNLQEVHMDWNYLRLFGEDLVLPAHRLSVRLASNPWRCDCGMLEARDSYDVLDVNLLQCADSLSYSVCNDCQRYFLPLEDGRLVYNLTSESIEHLGCTGLSDQFYIIRKNLILMRDHEPEKLVRLAVLTATVVLLLVALVMMCRQVCARKKFDHQAWLKIQQIPYLKINKFGKAQDVPYVKIDKK